MASAQSDIVLDCNLMDCEEASSAAVIKWFKNGEVVVTSDYFLVDQSGRRLRILGLLASDAGVYQCFVSNDAGMVQSAVLLSVLPLGSLL